MSGIQVLVIDHNIDSEIHKVPKIDLSIGGQRVWLVPDSDSCLGFYGIKPDCVGCDTPDIEYRHKDRPRFEGCLQEKRFHIYDHKTGERYSCDLR